jgi:two-component system response regulator FixJ
MSEQEIVYVVDDERAVLSSLSALLVAHGIEARMFESGESLLASVSRDSVGCVITDYRMPSLNGRQLQSQLSVLAPTLPVIVVTGYADVPTAVGFMSEGATTVLEKPLKTAELMSAISNAISKSQELNSQHRRAQELQQRLATLTNEEKEVAAEMIDGTPIKAIARNMRISKRTVDRRRQSVLTKMQAGSIGELAMLCSEIPVRLDPDSGKVIRLDRPSTSSTPEMHRHSVTITNDIPTGHRLHSADG